jgi:hypothetical protein
MAWTQDDVDEIKKAIASGAEEVQFSDRRIKFRSKDEMLELLKLMQDEVAGANSSSSEAVSPFQSVEFSKGKR